MFSHLKAQWNLSDGQLGALVSVVSVTVALGAVPLSLLADRWSRVKSIFLMALVWSIATISCAFAGSYAHLLGARSIVGVGEAAYGTVGAAFLATLFPLRMRSSVLGGFFLAGILGSVLVWCWASSLSTGAGSRLRRRRRTVIGPRLRIPFLVRDYKTVALPTAAGAGRRTSRGARHRDGALRPRTRRRMHRRRLQLLTLS
jgi:MFS family permease